MPVATPVGGLWPYIFKAFHDTASDLPEDFFERVEEGVDTETRARLVAGFEAAGWITQVRNWAWLALGIGIALAMVGGILSFALPGYHVPVLFFAGDLLLGGILLYAYAFHLAHRKELHAFLAFVQAARPSSLGRDLA